MMRGLRWAGAGCVLACAACGGGDDERPAAVAMADTAASEGMEKQPVPAASPLQPGAQSPARPALDWRPCGSLECTEVMVPLDRSDPGGQQISIALNRQAAAPGVTNRGVLLFNPGGPGEPGKPFLEALGPSLAGIPFDLIGFDPRGVGDSTRIDCTQQVDPGAVYVAQGVGAAMAALRPEAEKCRQTVGPLFDHLGTNAVVADIEQIRLALGVDRINFYGLSYGTRLGDVYAQTYPDRIRALILDSPMPPKADLPALVAAQFDAEVAAHQALISACEQGQLPCPADAAKIFDQLLQAEVAEGQRTGFLNFWALQLSNPIGRDALVQILAALEGADPNSDMTSVMDGMMALPEPPMVVGPNFSAATNLTVHCADSIVEPPSELEGEALMQSYEQRSEVFAPLGAASFSCAGWPVRRDPVQQISLSLPNPPLIIAGAADSLTPLPLAQELHAALPGSSLVVSQHYGHGALIFAGACVGQAIGRYLADLTLPPDGTVCPVP